MAVECPACSEGRMRIRIPTLAVWQFRDGDLKCRKNFAAEEYREA